MAPGPFGDHFLHRCCEGVAVLDGAVYVCGSEHGSSRVEPGFIVVGGLGIPTGTGIDICVVVGGGGGGVLGGGV